MSEFDRPHITAPDVRGCVSFSLYGDDAVYAWGAIQNVALASKFYPGWQCRVYLERGHYAKRALLEAGAMVIEMEPLPNSGGMFWRFMAADDPQFTHVIVRDADSRISPRDAACTNAWIESGKVLHVIKDHPGHRKQAVIGGAWGIKAGCMAMCDDISGWRHSYNYGDDEEFLHRKVWERFRPYDDFLYHDYEGGYAGCALPIPAHEDCAGHVCERVPLDFTIPGKWRAFVLSAPHYAARRIMFNESLAAHGGILRDKVETVIGKSFGECVVPHNYPHATSAPHYFLATEDHKNTWRRALDEDLDFVFIFEDDAMFRADFTECLARAVMCVPDDWLAMQLGGQAHTDHHRAWYTDAHGNVKFPRALARVRGCLGMHGTLWTREGLRLAVERYDKNPQAIVDWEFAGWQRDVDRFYTPMRWVVEVNPHTDQGGRAS